ncbi:MAG TPA: TonB family protein [Hanamia sp.]
MEKSVYQRLQEWHELLKDGTITEAEFAVKKEELLVGEKKIETLLPQDQIHILAEEQTQFDEEPDILINTETWFYKNKIWFIGLSIAILFGGAIWYFSKTNRNSYNSDIKSADSSIVFTNMSNAYYIVKADSSNNIFFYRKADISTKKSSYFSTKDTVYVQKIDNDFGYIKFINSEGKTSKGWLRMQDLQYCSDCLDLKAKFDRNEQEKREEQAQEASDNAKRVTDADSTNIKKHVDSFNPQQEKTKVPDLNNSPQAKNSEVKQVTDEDLHIFTSVEQVPEFQGGLDAFGRFLGKNIRYPAVARENGTQGRVIISFVCERDGSLTDIKVARGIGDGCDQEAVRVMTASPKWQPGIQNGRPVRVAYSVPISFTIGSNQ